MWMTWAASAKAWSRSPYSKTPRQTSVGAHGFVQDGLIGGGELGIDDGGQRLVFHAHQFGGVFGDGSGFGDDGGNRLSLIAGAIDRHGIVEDAIAGSGTDLEERIDQLGDLRASQSADDAGKSFGLGDIDAGDGGVSVGRAHEDQVQHAQHLDVVNKLAAAADQARVFLALDRLADPVGGLAMGCGCHDLLACWRPQFQPCFRRLSSRPERRDLRFKCCTATKGVFLRAEKSKSRFLTGRSRFVMTKR